MLRLCLSVLVVVRAQSSELEDVRSHVQINDSTQTSGATGDVDRSMLNTGIDPGLPGVLVSDFAGDLCIHAEQGMVMGSILLLARCDQQSIQFKWSNETQQISLALKPELCVEMRSNSAAGSQLIEHDDASPEKMLLQLQHCTSGAKQQMWLVGTSVKSKARPDLCISPDASALKHHTASAALEVAYCKSSREQSFLYLPAEQAVELLTKTQELTSAKDLLKTHEEDYLPHSSQVDATGRLHVKHGRKIATYDGKLLNLDISESKAHHENVSDAMRLMRRTSAAAVEQEKMPETEAGSKEILAADPPKHTKMTGKAEIDALLERINEGFDGLVEDEDDEELHIDDALERSLQMKKRGRRRNPPPAPARVNCVWGKWSKWSSCSADCGGGTKDREREEKIPADYGGSQCDGEAEEEEECNKTPCTPPAPPPTTPPPAATTGAPMMAKGGAPVTVSLTPAVFLLVLLSSFQTLRSIQ